MKPFPGLLFFSTEITFKCGPLGLTFCHSTNIYFTPMTCQPHLSKNMMEVKEIANANSQCKGPGVGTCLAFVWGVARRPVWPEQSMRGK